MKRRGNIIHKGDGERLRREGIRRMCERGACTTCPFSVQGLYSEKIEWDGKGGQWEISGNARFEQLKEGENRLDG